jgi:hypothetical protein
VSKIGTVYWKGVNWAVGEAFSGLKVAFEPNPETNAKPNTRLVRFANVEMGIIGDSVWKRLRPTACAVSTRKDACSRKTQQS